MTNMQELSHARHALLEKYLRTNHSQKKAFIKTIPKRDAESLLPLSFGQQQMWLLAQLIPDMPVYNEYAIFHLPGSLDVTILERSLNEIIQRHEAWRTSFPTVDSQPFQKIHPLLTLTLPIVDLRHLPDDDGKDEALRLLSEDARIPFDLTNGPLLRATLIRLHDQEHWLCLAMHHIIFDGITIYQVFLPELHTLYNAFSVGKPTPLPPLPIQFADFATWQRERLQEGAFKDQMSYWKRQLQDAPAVLELPTDRPRPSVKTYRGARYMLALSKDMLGALNALSSGENVTLYMTLVAAFQTLLHRYTGQDDILIGTVTGERKYPEIQKLMGFFLNTLVLRTDLSADPSFRELLRRVREVTLEAQVHQDVPFEYLIKELQPERSLAYNPLIQVMLSLEPRQPILDSGWNTVWWEAETITAKFDLELGLEERPEGIFGWVQYSTDLFDEATIARMVEHWQTLLEGIIANPESRLSELPLLSEKERYQLLVEWNATSTAYSKKKCIHQLFEAQVERTPDAIALVFENQQMTYQELNKQVNQLAHFLQKLGVGPEVLVGLCMDRSLEMIVGLLAILKAGGAYVPIDPAYPKDRLAFLLHDTLAPVLLTQQQLTTKLPEYEGRVVCMDADWEQISQESEENPASQVTAECLAYVIYTSGSTGKPKGVLVNHANVTRLFEATRTWFHFNNRDVWTLFHSYAFDFSVWELWGALLCGGRLVVVSYEVGRSPEAFYKLLETERVTVLNQTPSAFYQLIQEEKSSYTTQNLALRLVIFGGEALDFQSLKTWFDRHGDQHPQLVNMYGITETTVHVTYYPLSRSDAERASGSIIGKPIIDLQVYILDQYRQLVPIGVHGEMYIGGNGLARGYLNRPELTDERFIPNPFSQLPDARLYKTGDLARYLPNGDIEFLGRMDHQVKIRGYRIELGEIEALLKQHPEVHQAVLLVREDRPGDKRLVAYVVPYKNHSVVVDSLKNHVMKQVPDYMVPASFVLLDALPLTPNGKIDHPALPTPLSIRSSVQETYVAPTSLVHYQLVQIWEELLDVRPIGIQDNFFYLGGHSLLATRLVNRMEQSFGKKVPLATLFTGPTIEQLAKVVMQQEDTGSSTALGVVAVQAKGTRSPFFYLHGDYTGGSFYCFALARMLGTDQPFYALEPYTFDGVKVLPTIEDMASAQMNVLRAIQPQGPYLLGGFCNGALVAYEMARQFQAQGERVDFLVLIEPGDVPVMHKLVRKGISIIGKLMRSNQEKQLVWFLRLRHVYKYMVHHRRLDLKELGIIDPSMQTLNPTAEALCQDSIGIVHWLVAGYQYYLYPDKFTLFRCSEEPFRGIWQRKVVKEENINVIVIPGTHESCRTDYIQIFAEQLKLCLRKVQVTEAQE